MFTGGGIKICQENLVPRVVLGGVGPGRRRRPLPPSLPHPLGRPGRKKNLRVVLFLLMKLSSHWDNFLASAALFVLCSLVAAEECKRLLDFWQPMNALTAAVLIGNNPKVEVQQSRKKRPTWPMHDDSVGCSFVFRHSC